MTSHLEEGVLQELLDGEIPSSELPPLQAHLAICAECRARLDEARTIGAEADRLIETIDLSEAPVRVAPRIPRARPKPWTRNLAWAATLVIAAGTGYLARGTTTAPQIMAMQESKVVGALQDSGAAAPAEPVVTSPPPAESERRGDQPSDERGKAAAGGGASRGPARREAPPPAARGFAKASTDSGDLGKKRERSLDTLAKLNEVITTGTAIAQSVAPRPATPPSASPETARKELDLRAGVRQSAPANRLEETVLARDAAKSAPRAVEITLSDAITRLDGSLRLIEGLVPVRLEALGTDVRVVYPLSSGELLLIQRLERGKITFRLLAPPGFPADSLDRLYARVRD